MAELMRQFYPSPRRCLPLLEYDRRRCPISVQYSPGTQIRSREPVLNDYDTQSIFYKLTNIFNRFCVNA